LLFQFSRSCEVIACLKKEKANLWVIVERLH
jgi:hypothetical protein